jgi:hypothetical protein
MHLLASLLRTCRTSSRLIQSVMLAFVLNLGVAIAAPALQAANLSPDQQMICVGTGGMKIITFASDGSVSDLQTTNGSDCPLCTALLALVSTGQYQPDIRATLSDKPIPIKLAAHATSQSRAPPARAPPAI